MRRRRVAVEIQRSTGCDTIPEPGRIRAWVRAAIGDSESGEITVRLVDEAESADLNQRYRGRSYATNVLAFGAEPVMPSTTHDLLPLGDLVVCAPIVVREAADQHKTPEAHWAHILMHGCLHLLGYDHQSDEQAHVMEARERLLLAQFGFPDPYGRAY